jgi:hypothetical protein
VRLQTLQDEPGTSEPDSVQSNKTNTIRTSKKEREKKSSTLLKDHDSSFAYDPDFVQQHITDYDVTLWQDILHAACLLLISQVSIDCKTFVISRKIKKKHHPHFYLGFFLCKHRSIAHNKPTNKA